MNELLLILPLALPLLVIPLVLQPAGAKWLAIAPVPALLAGLTVPTGSSLSLSWLLLGTHLHFDETSRLFMLFGSMVWLLGALYFILGRTEEASRPGFKTCFLLAMSGYMVLILAADMLTFYLGFALMGLSAYGLLLRGSQRSRSAGRVYLTFTLVGELALFTAIVVLYATVDSLLFADLARQPLPDVAIALLVFGFGIKLALPGLHFWLPAAYSVAPIVGVAVLSGPMMKAGLLGWVRFIPAGAEETAAWGDALIALGTLGVLLGVFAGVMQHRPRTLLAYSSITKMGAISAFFGAALTQPHQAHAIIAALIILAMHHLLVKPMLFLGVDLRERGLSGRWTIAGLFLLALSLASAPLTGGNAAKLLTGLALDGKLQWLLTLSAIGTTMLMARFIWLLLQQRREKAASRPAPILLWLCFLPIAVWGPFTPDQLTLDLASIGPLVIGIALFGLGGMVLRRRQTMTMRLSLPNPFSVRTFSRTSISPLRLLPKGEKPVRPVLSKTWLSGPALDGDQTGLAWPGLWWFVSMVILLGALMLPV